MAYTNIDLPTDYFNTVLYAGNDTGQSITTGIANDFVWIKDRGGTDAHTLFDVIRTPLQRIQTNISSAESTLAGSLTAFNSNGFTVGNSDNVNDIGHNFVSWNWLAGGAGVSNTAGTITSTVSANTTAGFSIVGWTGNASNSTVGHSLGVVPKMIIVKNRSAVEDWAIYHSTLGNTKFLEFTTGAAQTSSTIWNDTSPTSTLFTVGTNSKVNGNTNNMIAYCFAEIKGYSKIDSYTGNGDANGTFVYTGFKPAFFIVKRNDAGYDWLLYDNKRQVSFNVVDDFLKPNLNEAETTGNANQSLDFLSNGVKFRGNGASSNDSGASYIYMAFAENPFVTSKGIPTTAR